MFRQATIQPQMYILKKISPIDAAAIAFAVTAVAMLAAQFLTLAPDLLFNWDSEDSFYYFEVAKNWARTGSRTFDGISTTNGFQPLWLLFITPAFLLFDGDVLPVRFIHVVQAVLVGGILLALYALVHRCTANRPVALVSSLAVFWAGFYALLLSGKESAIGVLAVVLLLLAAERWWRTGHASIRAAGLVGIAAAAVIVSRLDLAPLLVVYFGFVGIAIVGQPCRRTLFKPFITAALIPSAAVVTYLVSNYIWFERHLMPITARIKMDLSTAHWMDFDMWRNVVEFHWSGVVPDLGLFLYIWPAIGGIALSIVPVRQNHRLLSIALRIVAASYLVQLISWHLFSVVRIVWPWWLILSIPLAALVVAWLLMEINAVASRVRWNWPVIQGLLAMGLAMLVLMGLGRVLFTFTHTPDQTHLDSLNIVRVIDGLPGQVFAMGDGAGGVGYFSRKSIVHLEGYVNNYEYQDYLKQGRLEDYFRDKGVEYLITRVADPAVVKGNYDTYVHTEPRPLPVKQSDWKGPWGSVTVRKGDEVYRELLGGQIPVALIIWKLK